MACLPDVSPASAPASEATRATTAELAGIYVLIEAVEKTIGPEHGPSLNVLPSTISP